jgi:hypothetical protein
MKTAMCKAIGFLDGQGIHVCANAQTLFALPSNQLRYQACCGETSRHAVAPTFKLFRQQS